MYNDSEREEPSNSENFVIFGTAFPETTEKDRRAGRSDAGQFVPLWKQEARDEKGRRRFHGAFTGGFSAGYYNTVGSKEGWEPSSFVSSRESRTERKEARPEDFMDEEDLQELEGARKLVTTEEFDILGGTERELAARRKELQADEDRGSGVGFLGASLMNMFGPPTDSLGVRLLRKMGWKPGQGVGPRIKKRQEDDDDDEYMNNVDFAPRDTPIENYQPKRDTYGLGYDLSASVPEIAEMKRLRELAKKEEDDNSSSKHRSSFGLFDNKKSAGGDAFGLGAFEDDDDDDIYSDKRGNNYHHSLYDDEGGYTRDQLKYQSKKMKERGKELKEKSSSNKTRCSDDRLPLDGFTMANHNQQIGKWYAPPKVPSDFDEKHVSDINQITASTKISQDSTFSFEERGTALGEKPIEQRSVFDYISKNSKDRLDQLLHSVTEEVKDRTQLADFQVVTKEVANLALRGFIPFGDNPKKQDRYRDYLENMAGKLTEDGTPKKVLPIPQGLSYDAGMKELDDFAKAARIFRPISQMMEGRFTSASATSKNIEMVSFEGGLKTEEQYRKEREVRDKELNSEPEKKQISQEAEAASMNMFGGLTRTVKPFYPNRLVCKRFNIRNPHPNHDPNAKQGGSSGRTQAGSRDALTKETVDSMLNERLPLKFESVSKPETLTMDDPLLTAVIPKPSDRSSSESAPPKNVGIEKEVTTKDEELPDLDYERPSMDIFKAIFDDSDDEEEGDEEKNEQPLQESKEIIRNEQDDFIGPPLPPKAHTAEIELTGSSTAPEPFRPMFKRASERKEPVASSSIPAIASEEVVVQPFKPRHTQKRRRVSISEDEKEDKSSEDYHSKRHRSSKHKESKSSRHRDRKEKDRKDRHSSSSSKKRDRSKDRKSSSKHRHKSSSKRKYEDEDDFEGMWVEKEPMTEEVSSTSKRKRAADLW
ncbi:hypothetical protein K501DRAFT_254693 [Backusella circina FSU 941]|nr:hypothetical protein K501DRAFT_254693 [Backusella circina FSU 941]